MAQSEKAQQVLDLVSDMLMNLANLFEEKKDAPNPNREWRVASGEPLQMTIVVPGYKVRWGHSDGHGVVLLLDELKED